MEEKELKKETKRSNADTLWNEIKSLPLEVYSLPDQTVQDHTEYFRGDPEVVYLKTSSPAVLPALEEALGCDARKVALGKNKYTLEQTDLFLVVKRAEKIVVSKTPFLKKK